MKKILSLTIALLLVFAIAAPAMAITGYVDPANSTLANPPWAGNLKLTAGNPNLINLLSMSDISANKAYIYNETLYYVVSLYTPTASTCSYPGYDYRYTAGNEAYVRLSSDVAVMQQNTVAVYLVPSGNSTIITATSNAGFAAPDVFKTELDSYKNELKVYLPFASATAALEGGSYPADAGAKTTYIVGTAIVSANVNGTLKAVIRSGQMNKWKSMGSDNLFSAAMINAAAGYQFYSGKTLKYQVYRELGSLSSVDTPADRIMVYINDGTYAGHHVAFERTAAKVVCKDGIYVHDGTNYYRVLMPQWVGSGVSELTFQAATANGGVVLGSTITSGSHPTKFNDLNGAYNEVMNFFGFVYSAEGKLYDMHFTQKLQAYGAEAEVPVTLYGSAIVIPDAGTDVPQTGDAASTLGFVMIALAIVAAAGVAYKKVRA